MAQDYFIADTHFGSETIIRYENRPFKSVSDMEKSLIENWNQCVKNEDFVYVLGDFSDDYSMQENERVLKQLSGRKILVMGNHDINYTPKQWMDMGFELCSPWPIVYKEFFMLSHEPMYLNNNMPYANVFGHVHGNITYQSVTSQSACVSAERIQYCPISFEKLIEKMKNS